MARRFAGVFDCRVDGVLGVGTVSIYPMIDGSFDSEDAPFDPKRNTLYVGATLPSRFGSTSPEAATRC